MNARTIAAWILGGGVGIAIGIAILALAAQQWISIEIGSQLEGAGITPKTEIVEMKGDIEDNAEDIVRVESKAERIAQILMED